MSGSCRQKVDEKVENLREQREECEGKTGIATSVKQVPVVRNNLKGCSTPVLLSELV